MTPGAARKPAVSVVVLSYDRPRRLRSALESIRAQSLPPTEILVIDNPSQSSDQIRRECAAVSGVNLLSTGRNVGFAGGMNFGLSLAGCELVLLTEDDL